MAPVSPIHLEQDDIVRESIIENKERTKSYWEQRMLAAAAENCNTIRPSNSNRNSVSSVDSTMTDSSGGGGGGVGDEEPNVKEEKRRIEMRQARQLAENNNVSHEQTMQEKIAQELREMREREQELAFMRQRSTITSLESSIDDGNCSEYGSDENKEHSLEITSNKEDNRIEYRAQSLESISSGLSTASLASSGGSNNVIIPKRRHITVRPYDDPESEIPLTPVALYNRNEKETPIEREIRLAREREEELRRAQGSAAVPISVEPNGFTLVRRKDALENDTRGVQHRIATNRIQQEIEEASERELELRTEGKILTISMDTVDSKVTRFTQLAEQGNRHVIRRATSQHTQLDQDNNVPSLRRAVSSSNLLTSGNKNGGFLGRLIASKGRISMPFSKPLQSSNNNLQQSASNNLLYLPKTENDEIVDEIEKEEEEEPKNEPVLLIRKGFISAEQKIQSELREMQKREEELRIQRSKMMARSQPNLLAIDDENENLAADDDDENVNNESISLPTHYSSNPNLTEMQQYHNKLMNNNNTNQKGCRKRFSLLEEWENRIQKEL